MVFEMDRTERMMLFDITHMLHFGVKAGCVFLDSESRGFSFWQKKKKIVGSIFIKAKWICVLDCKNVVNYIQAVIAKPLYNVKLKVF